RQILFDCSYAPPLQQAIVDCGGFERNLDVHDCSSLHDDSFRFKLASETATRACAFTASVGERC
ncbi:MAG: hypothetical protein ACXWPS_03940, partial [Ktedonobacteraceae bacterium]